MAEITPLPSKQDGAAQAQDRVISEPNGTAATPLSRSSNGADVAQRISWPRSLARRVAHTVYVIVRPVSRRVLEFVATKIAEHLQRTIAECADAAAQERMSRFELRNAAALAEIRQLARATEGVVLTLALDVQSLSLTKTSSNPDSTSQCDG
jgi:hypothetical protein